MIDEMKKWLSDLATWRNANREMQEQFLFEINEYLAETDLEFNNVQVQRLWLFWYAGWMFAHLPKVTP